MKMHKFAFSLSIFLVLGSLVLVLTKGLNLGIDFSGGILIEARMPDNKTNISDIRSLLNKEAKEVQIQNIGQQDILIRISKEESSNEADNQSLLVKKIQQVLVNHYPNIEFRKVDYVGPQIGGELIQKGFLALLLSFVFIMIYIWIRFDWQFGLGGILALVHDAVITLGFFSLTQLEFNLTSIAAILTVIGYSINDSVVIYDRVRENLRRFKKMDLSELLNISINSTLSRTVLTGGTTLTSLLALILFGGEVLKSFSVATFFGVAFGTYSSIYISAPILLYLDPRKKKDEKSEEL